MAEVREKPSVGTPKTRKARRRIRHRGRMSQISIYLGKQLRFFIHENDWKVLPMAAVIASLVGIVIRNRFFVNMEGSLISGFALTCVAIWNGCFNSIQSVCRERAIIKREHRSGMHISSYVAAHMIYQFLLCTAQAGLSMYVLVLMGIRFPAKGFMTPLMQIDIGISMLIISYAADMMSLFLSSISRTTTAAMTLMPFVLIFQLVFSGGVIPLPAWSRSLSDLTISNYGIQVIAAQSGYNELPMVTAWNTLNNMRDSEIGGEITLGQILDVMDSKPVQDRRDLVLVDSSWLEAKVGAQAGETGGLETVETAGAPELSEQAAGNGTEDAAAAEVPEQADETAGSGTEDATDAEAPEEADETAESGTEEKSVKPILTLGQLVDFLKSQPLLQENRDRTVTLRAKLSDLFEIFGEEKVRDFVQQKTAEASYKEEYVRSRVNIVGNWVILIGFTLLFALLSVLVLKRIDRDKR